MDDQLKNRIFNYNAQPPDDVWDKINSGLDEESAQHFTGKLIKYELAPPPFVWDNVVASLDKNESTVIPFRKRFSKPLRYSTAAACLIGIAVFVSLLINKRSVSGEVANTPGVKQNISIINPAENTKQLPDSPLQNSDPVNYDLVTIKKAHAKKVSLLHSPSAANNLDERTNHVVSHNYPIKTSTELDRYIIFSTTTGEAFRLSKKLFDLFACSSDNENCRQNIEYMQQRMASPAIMASADFSGLMDILQTMNNQ
jgi:hypothetical protein